MAASDSSLQFSRCERYDLEPETLQLAEAQHPDSRLLASDEVGVESTPPAFEDFSRNPV